MNSRRQRGKPDPKQSVEILSETTPGSQQPDRSPSATARSEEPVAGPATHDGQTSSTSFAVERRSLWPILALVAAVAAVLLWTSGQPAPPPEAATAEISEVPTATALIEPPSDAASTEPSLERLGGLAPDDRFYLVPIPTSDFSAFEANVLSVGADEFQGRELGFRMFSGGGASVRLNPGVDRHPLITTNQGLVIVGVGEIYLQDADLLRPAESVGEGIGALPGPNPNSIWILGTAERTVELYDLSNRRSVTTYSLEGKGRPLSAVDTGLVLADRQLSPGNDFLFWDPIHGLIELEGTDDVEFYGANGSTVVFGTATELVVFDVGGLNVNRRQELDNGKLTGRRLASDLEGVWGSSLSPDGSLLAATVLTPLTEPNIIKLIDVETGEVRNTIQNALEFQYRWSGPDTLVYMRPDWPAAILAERDSNTGVDRQVMWLNSFAWWYGIAPPTTDE